MTRRSSGKLQKKGDNDLSGRHIHRITFPEAHKGCGDRGAKGAAGGGRSGHIDQGAARQHTPTPWP